MNHHLLSRREWALAAVAALIVSFVTVYAMNTHPTNLDAYYHANAANRMAQGLGMTDTGLWIYLGLPPDMPIPVTETPSHLYWMPATSLLSGVFMSVFGVTYEVARLPMALSLAGAMLLTLLAVGWVGGKRRHLIVAAMLIVFSSSYADKWGEIDTYAPYALFGAGALLAMIYASETGRLRGWFIAGLLAGASHLTRADGLLMMIVAVMAIAVYGGRTRPRSLAVLVVGYLLVMTPWFIRMYGVVGAPLPLGGLQTAYLREYMEIFSYPWQELSISSVGIPALIQARIDAFGMNVMRFIVSEGWLIVWPLFLWGLFIARSSARFVIGMFALGLHVAMFFVFTWPSVHSSLFHGASALMPMWAALTPLGIDALARAITRRRVSYQPLAILIISLLVVGIAIFGTLQRFRPTDHTQMYTALMPYLTTDDRLLLTNPMRMYYHTGIGGVVLPYMELDSLPTLAEHFGIDYLLLEEIKMTNEKLQATAPSQLLPILTEVPPFLELVVDLGDMRLYRFR